MLLVVESIGMRALVDHVVPLLEVLSTMSLAVQFWRKLQSCHTTKTLPAPSCAADGSEGERIPVELWSTSAEILIALLQVLPPSLETMSSMFAPPSEKGTITVPFGWA